MSLDMMPIHAEATDLTNCLACGCPFLAKYLDLGVQHLANDFHEGYDPHLPQYPLEIQFCTSCHHSQLTKAVDPKIIYSNYPYITGTSKTFVNHCEELAKDACDHHAIHGRASIPHVVDIACNDGTLLKAFRRLGKSILGIDPAENIRELSKREGIPVEVAYWHRNYQLSKLADIIIAQNVFAHSSDPHGFLYAISQNLTPGGVAILEFPYAISMLKGGQFDTIYHEHINYFTINSLVHALEGTGLKIAKFEEFPDLHGGSIRVYLDKRPHHDMLVYFRIKHEMEILTPGFFGDFATRVEEIKSQFMELIEGIRWEDDTLICYGASAKSTVMLNYFGIQPAYVVDDTLAKQWMYTPGTDCEIKPSIALSEDRRPLTIILTAWNFAQEIIPKITDLRKNSLETSVVTYLPSVGVLKSIT